MKFFFMISAVVLITNGSRLQAEYGRTALQLKNYPLKIQETRPLTDISKPITRVVQLGDTLAGAWAVKPESWASNQMGFYFSIEAVLKNGKTHVLYENVLYPFKNKQDRGWQPFDLSLESLQNQGTVFSFKTGTVGPLTGLKATAWGDSVLLGGLRIGNFKRRSEEMNVILISLDTLRSDRLSINGYARETTPQIDALARQSVFFKDAISQASWTLPAHVSVFTGLYPTSHGMVRYGLSQENLQYEIPVEIKTLTEYFQENKYLTRAFTGSAYLSATFGFYRGFDSFVEKSTKNHSEAAFIFDQGMKWIDQHADQKFFLFLHTYEIHSPYTHDTFTKNETFLNKQDRLSALYDGDVHYTDSFIGKLMKKLKDLDLTKNTIVVLFSDHGEELNTHFPYGTHAHTLYDELIKVPLLFFSPGKFAPKIVKGFQPELVDIMPTLLEVFGLPFDLSTIQGKSLLSILKGGKIPSESIAFSESTPLGPERKSMRLVKNSKTYKLIVAPEIHPFERGLPPFPGNRKKDHSLLKNPLNRDVEKQIGSMGGVEFYDLTSDPGEKENQAPKKTPLFLQMKNNLEKFLLSLPHFADHKAEASIENEELKEKLRALGY